MLTNIIRGQITKGEGVIVWRHLVRDYSYRTQHYYQYYNYFILVPIPYSESYILNFKPNREMVALTWVDQLEILTGEASVTAFSPILATFIEYITSPLNVEILLKQV